MVVRKYFMFSNRYQLIILNSLLRYLVPLHCTRFDRMQRQEDMDTGVRVGKTMHHNKTSFAV